MTEDAKATVFALKTLRKTPQIMLFTDFSSNCTILLILRELSSYSPPRVYRVDNLIYIKITTLFVEVEIQTLWEYISWSR